MGEDLLPLTRHTSPSTIASSYRDGAISCCPDRGGHPDARQSFPPIPNNSCPDVLAGAWPFPSEAATPHTHLSLPKGGLSRRLPGWIDRTCSTLEEVRLRAGIFVSQLFSKPGARPHCAWGAAFLAHHSALRDDPQRFRTELSGAFSRTSPSPPPHRGGPDTGRRAGHRRLSDSRLRRSFAVQRLRARASCLCPWTIEPNADEEGWHVSRP
jgi:hypothetical protein